MAEKIGVCGVDAGLLMVGDPCYFIGPHSQGANTDWSKFCDELDTPQKKYALGHDGFCVCIGTAYGDGEYPVYRVGAGNMVVVSGDIQECADELRKLADMLEQEDDDQ